MHVSQEPEIASLRTNLLRTVHRHPERPAVTYRVDTGPGIGCHWRTLTWHEVALLVSEVAAALDDLGDPGCTVAVLATTDARYPILEQAVIVTGRRFQPLYTSSGDDELTQAIKLTHASVLVVGDDQWTRVQTGPLAADLSGSVRAVQLSAVVRLPGTGGTHRGLLAADTEPFDTDQVRTSLSKWPELSGSDAVLYLQTTGTTGPARVIEISQAAILAAIHALPNELLKPHPVLLSFLPTAHISERLLSGYLSVVLAGHSWFGGGTATLAEDLLHCRPTVFLAPPLVLEAIRSEATAAASRSMLGRQLLKSVTADAVRACSSPLTGATHRRWRTRLFSWLVRHKSGLGHADIALAGTAPLAQDLHAWWETLGLRLRNVYGQTEVSGATSMTESMHSIRGGVGQPLHGVEVKVDENEELLVRSPSLFTRYVGDEQSTAEAFDSGWFKTGDRARLADNGDLVLLGRIQSMIPTADGGVADLTDLAQRITSVVGTADVAYFRDESGVYLYVAVHPEGVPRHVLIEGEFLEPAAPSDPVIEAVQSQLYAFPGRQEIVGIGLFHGGFSCLNGEVGPTGKPRGWRIHQLRRANVHVWDAALLDNADRRLAAIPQMCGSPPPSPCDEDTVVSLRVSLLAPEINR